MTDSGQTTSKGLRPSSLGYYDYSSSDPANWRPWGLFDHKSIPEPSEAAFSAAYEQVKTDPAPDRATLVGWLRGIAEEYWQRRRSADQPPLSWYRHKNIEPIRGAFAATLELLQTTPGLYRLNNRIKTQMNRSLKTGMGRVGTSESIEELLEQVLGVCDQMLQKKAKPGNRKNRPVMEAAKQAAKIWHEVNGKRIGVSLDISTDEHWKFGPSKQVFSYPGPLFVQTVLQGVDPKLSVQKIRTALRDVLSPGSSMRTRKRKRKL